MGTPMDMSLAVATLLPPAFYRYRHEKRGPLRKSFRIMVLKYKDILAIVAFVISVLLLVLRILELGGYRLVLE